MPATVNTPPTTAQVVVRKWYHARPFSATMICTGDSAYDTCAGLKMSASVHTAWLKKTITTAHAASVGAIPRCIISGNQAVQAFVTLLVTHTIAVQYQLYCYAHAKWHLPSSVRILQAP